MKTRNFTFGETTSGDNFIDRIEESKRLAANFENQINTILISPRRWGKSSLVEKVAQDLNRKSDTLKVVLMDAFLCRSEEDFLKTFSTEIIKQTASKWEEWVENTKKMLTALVPKISIGMDPYNDFSLSFDFSDKGNCTKEILNLPQKIAEEKGIGIVVCIDEFQQISDFKDSLAFQKEMRSYWQRQKNVNYCLYGSKKHILTGLFSKQSMPFYKFGDLILLPKIETKYWIPYICGQFEKSGKRISEAFANRICETVENHSSSVQQFSWLIWYNTEDEVDEEIFAQSLEDLIHQNSTLFYHNVDGLTQMQLNFLRALTDNVSSGFTQSKILKEYQLGTAPNVKRIITALENREIIDVDAHKVSFNDPVFKLWLKRNF